MVWHKNPKAFIKMHSLYVRYCLNFHGVSNAEKKDRPETCLSCAVVQAMLLELSKVPNDVFKKKYPNLFWLYIISNPLVVFSCMPFLSRAPANRNRLWRITTGSSAHHISAHERHPQCKPAIAFLVKYNRGCIPKSLTCKRKQEIHLGFGLGFEPLSFFAITQYFFSFRKNVCGCLWVKFMFGKLVSSCGACYKHINVYICFGGLLVNISVPNSHFQAIARIPLAWSRKQSSRFIWV